MCRVVTLAGDEQRRTGVWRWEALPLPTRNQSDQLEVHLGIPGPVSAGSLLPTGDIWGRRTLLEQPPCYRAEEEATGSRDKNTGVSYSTKKI